MLYALESLLNGANGARSKNGMHSHREYNILASEATEGGRARGGGGGRKGRPWGLGRKRGTEEGGGGGQKPTARTPHAGTRRRADRGEGPPERSHVLTADGRRGGEGGGGPLT